MTYNYVPSPSDNVPESALPRGFISQAGGGPDQSLRRKAHWEVIVNGRNVTDILDPHLISIQVIDRIASLNGDDMCIIELDDRDASLTIPPTGASVQVSFGWESQGPRVPPAAPDPVNPFTGISARSIELPFVGSMHQVFTGFVHQVESGCSRAGGGRRMWIEAQATDPYTDGKSPQRATMGEGDPPGLGKTGGGDQIPFSAFAQKLAGNAGMSANVGQSFQGVKRNFWSAENASFLHYMTQMAHELGAGTKVSGNTMFFVGKNDLPFGEVRAVWGYNLIAWRIKPNLVRHQFAQVQSTHFERAAGAIQETISQVGNQGGPYGGATAQQQLPGATPHPQGADQENRGQAEDSVKNRTVGWVTMNGEPTAHAFAALTILGARPGIDGRYRIVEAEHVFSRQGGWITRCELDTPAEHYGGYNGWNYWVDEYRSRGRGNVGVGPVGATFDTRTLTPEQLEEMRRSQTSTGTLLPDALPVIPEGPST